MNTDGDLIPDSKTGEIHQGGIEHNTLRVSDF
jgi:hypothetical protein